MSFAENLARIRKEKGLSQMQLAELVGVSKGTIGNYESGKRTRIPAPIASALAKALEVDPGELAAEWPGLKVIDKSKAATIEQGKVIPSAKLTELDMSCVEDDHNFIRMAIAYSRLNEEAQEMAAGIVESIAHNPLCQKAENR